MKQILPAALALVFGSFMALTAASADEEKVGEEDLWGEDVQVEAPEAKVGVGLDDLGVTDEEGEEDEDGLIR